MEALLRAFLENATGQWAYASVFFVLVACGLGVPLPEDVSLLVGGFLAYSGAARLPVMMGVGFAGILVGDSLIFFAGRRVGSKVGENPTGLIARILTRDKRDKVARLFARHGQKIIVIARFLPGVRAVAYFTAGSAGLSYWRFVLFDGLAALASAPVFVFLGYHFGDELQELIDSVKKGQMGVFFVAAVSAAGFFVLRRARARRAAASAAEAIAARLAASPVQKRT